MATEIEISVNNKELKSVKGGIDKVNKALFRNAAFMSDVWKKFAKRFTSYITIRMKAKLNWPALAPRYAAWKIRAVERKKRIPVGVFGKKICKFTEMGKLTGIMYQSATKKDKYANIYEVKDLAGVTGGYFRFGIDGSKIAYPKRFEQTRPFFYPDEKELDELLKLVIRSLSKKAAKSYASK